MRPNFFIVGAAKSGTTSLASYLDQHPDIFVSKPKEPNFFAFEAGIRPHCRGPVDSDDLYELLLKYSVTDLVEYEGLFESAQNVRAIGEASVRYLYVPSSARRIAEYAPNAKIVVMLRHPVDRMHSHFTMNVSWNIEPLSFLGALAAEDSRVGELWGWDWHYSRVSNYPRQLREYLRWFPVDNIRVIFYEDFCRNTLGILRDLFRFLEVNESFVADTEERGMVGRPPRSRVVRSLVYGDSLGKRLVQNVVPKSYRNWASYLIKRANRGQSRRLHPGTRESLSGSFHGQQTEIEELIGRHAPW